MRLHRFEVLSRKKGSSVYSAVISVAVQPGDQLLGPESRSNTPRAVRKEEGDSNIQSKS